MTKGGKRGEEIEGGGIEGGDTELCAALPNLSCLHGSLVVRKNGSHPNFCLIKATGCPWLPKPASVCEATPCRILFVMLFG